MKFSVQGDALADSWNVYSNIYQGDALTKLKNIKAKINKIGDWVSVDHNTLPAGVLKNNPITHYENFYNATTTENATTTCYQKISDGTIISENDYNKLSNNQKGRTILDYTLQTMSIDALTEMNTRAIIQLDTKISALETIKLGGIINSQGDYVSDAVKTEIGKQIDAKLIKTKQEIKNEILLEIKSWSIFDKLKFLIN